MSGINCRLVVCILAVLICLRTELSRKGRMIHLDSCGLSISQWLP